MDISNHPFIRAKRGRIIAQRRMSGALLELFTFFNNPLMEQVYQNQFNETFKPNKAFCKYRGLRTFKKYINKDGSAQAKHDSFCRICS